MKTNNSNWSMRRTIVLLIMIGYTGILVLLLMIDMYMIADYQRSSRERHHNILDNYVESAGNTLVEMDRLLYSIYSNNTDFNNLSTEKNSDLQYGHAYEVQTELKMNAILNDTLDIGYVLYDSCQRQLSYNDSEKISGDTRREIGSYVQSVAETMEILRSTFTRESEGEYYRIIIYKKGNVAIAGAFNLGAVASQMEEELSEDAEVFILDNSIEIADDGKMKEIGVSEAIDEADSQFYYRTGKNIAYGQKLKNTATWICIIIPTSIWTYMNVGQILLLLVTASSLFAVVYLYFIINRHLVRPLRGLMDTMNKIREGDWKAQPDKDVRFEEFQQVNETLVTMVGEIEKQKMRSYEETIEKQKAKMQYLQLQLKPHFYLNGLKLLNTLVIGDRKEEMQDLIIGISAHLRYLLQTEREVVRLREEIDFTGNFIELHKNMYAKEIRYKITADNAVLDWMVPTLCIQTFVENSVKYSGLNTSATALCLDIKINRLKTEKGEFLDIMVSDNGQGYPKEVLEDINGEIKVGDRSVGINNLKRRCLMLYQDQVEYTFFNAEGAYSELVLPGREKG